ncbi:MAG: response regulator [Candidatus Omnitrophota bacterium]|nr:response regulator [Candidatus Omnitrophota bacterium]
MTKQKILIVDDELDILDFLKITLNGENYTVIEATNGKEALEKVYGCSPDLVVLDYKMPELDGIEVCRKLKKDILLQHLPIIMLTGKGELSDKIKGIDAGVDDYLVKPFEPRELVARVKMILRRSIRDLDANPLTRLPGNVSILRELEKRIKGNVPFAVGYVDLDKFKAFNDHRGFEEGDKVIRETGRILIRAVGEKGSPDDFIGHVGGDDFVLIAALKVVDDICRQIIRDFDVSISRFYTPEDQKRRYMVIKDRKGRKRKVLFISISIGVMTSEKKKIKHLAEVGEIGAELKSYAKSLSGSNYIKDRRRIESK